MSTRVNILAVLIVLGTGVPNGPIDLTRFETEGDGDGDSPSAPNPEVHPSAATDPTGNSYGFKKIEAEEDPGGVEPR